jgi:DNA repair exonuclease SbcCD nuclease subunit
MRLAIFSDVHLGHGSGTELEGDPFESLGEVLDKSLGCDLILIAGDLFDSRSPSTETLTRCMELLIKPLSHENGSRLVKGIGKDIKALTPLHQQGTPVVAIHGTHERRVKGLINPVQALEKAGFLIHLHANGVVLERDGERVCVQGLSGVPEHLSEAALKRWNPRPERGCYNIMMLHQSVSPFMYAEHLLPLERIPKGFDLYVLGHIHESRKADHSGSTLLIPGSLVPTKLTKEELSPRGFWFMDTRTGDAAFMTLESQRRVYYIEHEGEQDKLDLELEKLLQHPHQKKPLIRVKGRDLDVQGLNARFGERSLVSVRQTADKEQPEAVGIEQQSLSVRELGSKLLRQNLESAGLDTEVFGSVFELLEHGKPGEALRLLSPQRQHKAVNVQQSKAKRAD